MNFIELERPHGFLVWKGKQTAIASDEPLPVGEKVLIVSDGEAFGIATLERAAQMNDSEFDRGTWRELHCIYPEERRRFWPDTKAFYVHRIEAFEGYQRAKLFDGEKAIDYEPTEADKALMDQSRRLPKQIIIDPDAVILSDGKFSLRDGLDPAVLTEALKATYEAAPQFGQGDGETALTLYKLALVREPRMIVKKKSSTESPRAAVEPEHEEPMKAQDTKEQSIDQKLNFIRDQFRAAFMPEDEDYCDLWVREIFDTFLVAEEEGRLFRVAYMMVGESEIVFSSRDSWVEVEVNYAPKGFAKLGEFKRDKTAETETKHGFMGKIRAARDALGALLSFNADNLTMPLSKVFTTPSGFTVKEVDGQPWHVTWSTNAFEDREREIFSTKALEMYVEESMKRDDRGTFDLWHIPGTDFADKQFQAVIGQFLLEAGPYRNDEDGKAAMEFFKEYSESHPDLAPEGWGSSPEFRYLPEDRSDGVYDWLWITKTSTLPKTAAANVWTAASQEKSNMTTLTDDQKRLGEAIWGKEGFQKKIAEGEAKSQQLKDAGHAYKGDPEAQTETATENAVSVTATVEAADQPEPEAVEPEPAEPEATTVIMPEIEIDIEAIGAEVAKQFQVDLTPLTDALGEIALQFKELGDRVGKLEKAADVKTQTETPRFWLHLKRASEAEETVIQDNDGLKEKKPRQQHVEGSPAGHYFTKK